MNTIFKKATSDRLIVDVVAPGYTEKDIKVKVIPGATPEAPYSMQVKASGTSAEQKLGYFKRVGSLKETFGIDPKFDVEKATTAYEAGVLRVSVPIKDSRKAVTIHPAPAADEEAPAETESDE